MQTTVRDCLLYEQPHRADGVGGKNSMTRKRIKNAKIKTPCRLYYSERENKPVGVRLLPRALSFIAGIPYKHAEYINLVEITNVYRLGIYPFNKWSSYICIYVCTMTVISVNIERIMHLINIHVHIYMAVYNYVRTRII